MDMLADIMREGNWGLSGIEGRRIRDRDRRRGVIRSIGRERKLYTKVLITKLPRSPSFPRRGSTLPDEVIRLLYITDFVVIILCSYCRHYIGIRIKS
jgi:hypothetical protein